MTPSKATPTGIARIDDTASFRFVVAVFLALIAHMSFFLFKEAPSAVGTSKTVHRITAMLPPTPDNATQTALVEWVEILDSSYLVKPDRKRGFSTAPQRGIIEDVPLRLEERVSLNGDAGLERIPLPAPSPGDEARHLWSFAPAPIPPGPAFKPRKLEYPAWFSANGKPLPQLFHDLPKIRELLAASQKAKGETIMAIRFLEPGVYPEVEVERTCGDKKLDELAVRALTVKAETLPTHGKRNPFDKRLLSVKWRRK
jgi:hypothetical protein